MDIGQRVTASDGRPLVGDVVAIFPPCPPNTPMVAVIWDSDKAKQHRWFPTSQLRLVQAAPTSTGRKLRTWHREALVVASILATVAKAKGQSIEWLGALAVFFTFMHAQIAFRLAESEGRRTVAQVECHRKAQYYFLAKESCWLLYFICLGAWSALIGVLIFLLYPVWRKYHLRRKSYRVPKGAPSC